LKSLEKPGKAWKSLEKTGKAWKRLEKPTYEDLEKPKVVTHERRTYTESRIWVTSDLPEERLDFLGFFGGPFPLPVFEARVYGTVYWPTTTTTTTTTTIF
jgi:hypothetical protein